MEFRLVFDTIPDAFDRYRPHYPAIVYQTLFPYAHLTPGSAVLELGPGTGQATRPVLDTGCAYWGIELGEHLADRLAGNFQDYPNFHLIRGDFLTHDFGGQRFDCVFSAAAIQWMPEEAAFRKVYSLLKPGGTLAMMLIKTDYQTPNPALYDRIQAVYSRYYKPEQAYMPGRFRYGQAPAYGYVDFEKHTFPGRRQYTGAEYAALCATHADHITIPSPYREPFFTGIREAVEAFGDRIELLDTYVLYLARRPRHNPAAL